MFKGEGFACLKFVDTNFTDDGNFTNGNDTDFNCTDVFGNCTDDGNFTDSCAELGIFSDPCEDARCDLFANNTENGMAQTWKH